MSWKDTAEEVTPPSDWKSTAEAIDSPVSRQMGLAQTGDLDPKLKAMADAARRAGKPMKAADIAANSSPVEPDVDHLDDSFSSKLAAFSGATGNLAGRILAGRDALVDTAKADTSKEGLIAHLRAKYNEAEPKYQKYQAIANEDHPGLNLAGGLASSEFLPSGKTAAARIGGSALLGGVTTALGAQPGHFLEQGLKGTGVGAAAGAGGELIASKVIPWLRTKASGMAWKAIQGQPGITDIARKMGYETEPEMLQLGRDALDQGLIPAIGKPAQIADRAGKLIDTADNSASGLYSAAEMSGRPMDFADMLGAAEQAANTPARSAAGDDAMGAVGKFTDQIARQDSKTPGSYIGGRRLLTEAQDSLNLDTAAKLEAQLHRKSVMGARENLTSQVDEALGHGAGEDLAAANKAMSTGFDVRELANRAARRQLGHSLNVGGLLMGMAGGATAGAAMHGGAGAAGLGALGAIPSVVNYATKDFQPAALARALDFAVTPAGALATKAPAIGRSLSTPSPVQSGEASQGALDKLKAYFGGDVPQEEASKADFVKSQTDADYRKSR